MLTGSCALSFCRFYILGSAVKAQSAGHEIPKHQFEGLRILVAEDNELNREIAMELLSTAGIQVDSAENGLEAVEKIEQSEDGQFGMILMDIHMPVMDGLEATRKIRGLPSGRKANIPIIAMTADAFAEDILKCKNAGMDGHISKPVDIEKLFEMVRLYYNTGNEGGTE